MDGDGCELIYEGIRCEGRLRCLQESMGSSHDIIMGRFLPVHQRGHLRVGNRSGGYDNIKYPGIGEREQTCGKY